MTEKPTPAVDEARTRFATVMYRHFRPEDAQLRPAELVYTVMARYERERQEPIIDVNE